MMTLCHLYAAASVLFFVNNVSAATPEGWPTEIMQTVPTAQGPLQIMQIGEDGFRISIHGALLRELEGDGVDVIDTLPQGPAAQYLLLEVHTGGGSCSQLYHLLDVTPGSKPYLTGPIGTCAGNPMMRMKENRVEIMFSSFLNNPAQTWDYDPSAHRAERLWH